MQATITDWIMVVITAIYVLATIAIWVTNNIAASATRQQLAESRRQYEDKKRLEIMPYIQFEKTKGLPNHELKLALESSNGPVPYNGVFLFHMKNIGNGAAKDIMYTYYWDNFKKSADHGSFPVQALAAGEEQKIQFEYCYASIDNDAWAVKFAFRYEDLLENKYLQELVVQFKKSSSLGLELVKLSTSPPILL